MPSSIDIARNLGTSSYLWNLTLARRDPLAWLPTKSRCGIASVAIDRDDLDLDQYSTSRETTAHAPTQTHQLSTYLPWYWNIVVGTTCQPHDDSVRIACCCAATRYPTRPLYSCHAGDTSRTICGLRSRASDSSDQRFVVCKYPSGASSSVQHYTIEASQGHG